jgi:hypothetical protein
MPTTGADVRAKHLTPQQPTDRFSICAWWNNSLWYPVVPDEFVVRHFGTARDLAQWIIKWGNG